MDKKEFETIKSLLTGFRGETFEEMFMPNKWEWHHLRFKWVGMMSHQLFEINLFGEKVRQEVVNRAYKFTTIHGQERLPFTTHVYYAHPDGSLRKNFDDAVMDVILRMKSTVQKPAVVNP